MTRWTQAGSALTAAVAAFALAACGSSGEPGPQSGAPRPADTCSRSALGRLVGGADGVVQVDPRGNKPAELLRVDPHSGTVVSRCTGATAVSSVDPGPSSLVPQATVIRELGAAGPDAAVLPVIPSSLEHSATATTGARDWSTGRRTTLRASGYRIVSIITGGVLVQTGASATYGATGVLPRVTTAADFCVLPSLTAGRAACRPIPGAAGDGFPLVHVDGSLGWAPLHLVPATFGGRREYVVTDGSAIALPWPSRTVSTTDRIQPPDLMTDWGRVVLFDRLAATGSTPLRWGTVHTATATGVTGTLHTSTANAGGSFSFDLTDGCSASADGRTLSCLRNIPDGDAGVEVVTLRDGSSTLTRTSIRTSADDDLTGASHLVYWPAPHPGSTAS